MIFGIYFINHLHQYTLFIKDERFTQGAHTCLPAHFLFAPRTKCL